MNGDVLLLWFLLSFLIVANLDRGGRDVPCDDLSGGGVAVQAGWIDAEWHAVHGREGGGPDSDRLIPCKLGVLPLSLRVGSPRAAPRRRPPHVPCHRKRSVTRLPQNHSISQKER